jgi:hypothetical protein
MAFIPAPVGTVRAVYFHTVQGQECLVSHYFDLGPANADATELQDFANDAFSAYALRFKSLMSNECTIERVVMTNVQTANGIQATSNVAAVAGTSGDPATSNALALLISLHTGLSGRSFRGRMYLPGARSGAFQSDTNYFTTTYANEATTAATNYANDVNALTPVGATTAVWSVASYYELDPTLPVGERSVPRSIAVLTGISSVQGRTRVATQRRRRPRS